jgi:hypothetical protein
MLGSASLGAEPLDVVRDCAATAPGQASGIKALNSACPGLEDALQALGLERMLYEGWREKLNNDSLRDAAKLVLGYRGSTPAGAPEVAHLARILSDLARQQTPEPKSWWDVLLAWLDKWLGSHNADSLSWLDHLLERIQRSATVLHVILYSLTALMLIAAAWVVCNELQAAGVFARSRKRTAPATHDANAAAGLRLLESDPVALSDRLGALLRLLVKRLMQTGRLKSERSLTHRELVLRSVFDSESQRAVFAAVAGTAESTLYGGHAAAPEHLNKVLSQGQSLLAELPDSSSAR